MRQAMRQVLRTVSMEPAGYTDDNKPMYRVEDVATGLGITEDEVRKHVRKLEEEHGERLLRDEDEVSLVQ